MVTSKRVGSGHLSGPLCWFGGKGNQLRRLVPILEQIDHRVYVEPFGGGGSVLIAKSPKGLDVFNDIHEAVADFFRVLSDPKLFAKFYRRVQVLPSSRSLHKEAERVWREKQDIVERVSYWFVLCRQSFNGGITSGWSFPLRDQNTLGWLSCLERLPEIHRRLQGVQIDCIDYSTVLDRFDALDVLFYCDPPYLHETRRSSAERYEFEMTREQHEDLVARLLKLKGSVVLSGYKHECYSPLTENGWERQEFNVVTYASAAKGKRGGKDSRVECLWFNPRAQERREWLVA